MLSSFWIFLGLLTEGRFCKLVRLMKPLRFRTFEWSRTSSMGAYRWCSLAVAGWACLVGDTAGLAADWSQYRGAQTAGFSTETIRLDWQGGAPKCLWRVPTSAGLSSFVAPGHLFLTDRFGLRESRQRPTAMEIPVPYR